MAQLSRLSSATNRMQRAGKLAVPPLTCGQRCQPTEGREVSPYQRSTALLHPGQDQRAARGRCADRGVEPRLLGRPRTLPAVAESEAEDTSSAPESANCALHHLRYFGDGRAGLRVSLQRAHVFLGPRLDNATCRLCRLPGFNDLRILSCLLQSFGHYSGTPVERCAHRYATWR